MIDLRDILRTTDRLETVMILYQNLQLRLMELQERLETLEVAPQLLYHAFSTQRQLIESLVQLKEPLRCGEAFLECPHTDREREYLKDYLRAAKLKVMGLSSDTTELERICGAMYRNRDTGVLRRPAEKSNL